LDASDASVLVLAQLGSARLITMTGYFYATAVVVSSRYSLRREVLAHV
jgi:hypothetical protein